MAVVDNGVDGRHPELAANYVWTTTFSSCCFLLSPSKFFLDYVFV